MWWKGWKCMYSLYSDLASIHPFPAYAIPAQYLLPTSDWPLSMYFLFSDTAFNCLSFCSPSSPEMARTLFPAEGKQDNGNPQISESLRSSQSSEKSHRPQGVHQSGSWPGVQEPAAHFEPWNLQTHVFPRSSKWSTNATMGECAGESQECWGRYAHVHMLCNVLSEWFSARPSHVHGFVGEGKRGEVEWKS